MSLFKKLFKGKAGSKANRMEAKKAAGALLADKMDLNSNTIMYEYDRLRRHSDQSCFVGKGKAVAKLNRYCDVVPFDANRVVLEGSPTGYINASFLSSRPGDTPTWSYISTQGPLASTAGDFWLMVYEQKSNVIVMLTRVMEDFVEKCVQYYPEKEGLTVRFGELLVRCVGQSEVDPDVTMRELLIATHESGSWRKVTHYQYHAWPDHGVPETTGPIRKLCRQLQSQKLTGCPIVHCSAGIGRSGTFCAIDIMMRGVDIAETRGAAERAIDVKRIVSYLRKQRVGMVQTPAQYTFCHQAIRDDIDEQTGRLQRMEQHEGTVISRKLNTLASEQASAFAPPGQLRTIIESDGL